MPLPESKVRKVALLGRVGLSDGEVKALGKELSAILSFFQELEAYQASEAPVLSSLRSTAAGRSDTPRLLPEPARAAIRKNFPVKKEAALKVRSVFSA